jgi:multisubunit Na+/H+ antiporter MnhB subunit
MSPVDLAFAAGVVFAGVVLVFFIGRQMVREAREDRAAREAYGPNQPSWKDILPR